MWNLIYEEIRKRTDKVSYHLTKEPDIVFETDDGRTIAFEIESTLKTESRLMEKLNVLQKYDEWYFIVTQKNDKDHYQKYGPTITRMEILNKIEELLTPQKDPESKKGVNPSPRN